LWYEWICIWHIRVFGKHKAHKTAEVIIIHTTVRHDTRKVEGHGYELHMVSPPTWVFLLADKKRAECKKCNMGLTRPPNKNIMLIYQPKAGHQNYKTLLHKYVIRQVCYASSNMILNTLRMGDADLHLYITTVQDGWCTSAFLTHAWFPCT
jgi:hypothetical protein